MLKGVKISTKFGDRGSGNSIQYTRMSSTPPPPPHHVVYDPTLKFYLNDLNAFLQVNGYDFTQITHSAAVDVLKSSDTVELVLERPLVDE